MNKLQQIQEHPVYKQILTDSFGGVMYNVANQGKYETTELETLWQALTPSERESAGGITKGVFNFLQGAN